MDHVDNNRMGYNNHVDSNYHLRDARFDSHLCHLRWVDILDNLALVDNTCRGSI